MLTTLFFAGGVEAVVWGQFPWKTTTVDMSNI